VVGFHVGTVVLTTTANDEDVRIIAKVGDVNSRSVSETCTEGPVSESRTLQPVSES